MNVSGISDYVGPLTLESSFNNETEEINIKNLFLALVSLAIFPFLYKNPHFTNWLNFYGSNFSK